MVVPLGTIPIGIFWGGGSHVWPLGGMGSENLKLEPCEGGGVIDANI